MTLHTSQGGHPSDTNTFFLQMALGEIVVHIGMAGPCKNLSKQSLGKIIGKHLQTTMLNRRGPAIGCKIETIYQNLREGKLRKKKRATVKQKGDRETERHREKQRDLRENNKE